MGVSKVEFNTENGTETLIDLTGDTVTPETLAEGATAHDASGEQIVGTMRQGSGSSVQPDWNQNDPTQPDYVKNRTHWVESGGMTEILPETTPFFDENEQMFFLADVLVLEAEIEHTVMWNGTEYKCVAQPFDLDGFACVVLGNIGPMIGGDDTGEPFVIINLPPDAAAEMGGMFAMIVPFDGSTELTLSINAESKITHYLDPKFIKDMYYEGSPKTVFSGSYSGSNTDVVHSFTEADRPSLINGETYYVDWNGAEYTCVAKTIAVMGLEGIYIGDISSAGVAGDSTGEPFYILSMPDGTDGNYGFICTADGSTNIPVSVSISTKEIKKIDPKFLPAGEIGIVNILDGSSRGSARMLHAAAEINGYVLGECAFAEGDNTQAPGYASHSEGSDCVANGEDSHSEGNGTRANGAAQHVQGRYNVGDTGNRYAHIVGNGTNNNNRSNAHTIDWDGNAWFAGEVYVGGASQDEGKRVVKLSELTAALGSYITDIDTLIGGDE